MPRAPALSEEPFMAGLAAWAGARGLGFAVPPRDRTLAARWRSTGAPVAIVVAALDEAFARCDRRPRGLSFARREVDEAIARHLRTHVVSPVAQAQVPPPPSTADVLIARLVASGRSQTDPAVQEALRNGYRVLRQALGNDGDALASWGAARNAICAELEALLKPHERAMLQRDVTHDPRYGSMSDEAARAHREVAWQRWLAKRFGLIDLLD